MLDEPAEKQEQGVAVVPALVDGEVDLPVACSGRNQADRSEPPGVGQELSLTLGTPAPVPGVGLIEARLVDVDNDMATAHVPEVLGGRILPLQLTFGVVMSGVDVFGSLVGQAQFLLHVLLEGELTDSEAREVLQVLLQVWRREGELLVPDILGYGVPGALTQLPEPVPLGDLPSQLLISRILLTERTERRNLAAIVL